MKRDLTLTLNPPVSLNTSGNKRSPSRTVLRDLHGLLQRQFGIAKILLNRASPGMPRMSLLPFASRRKPAQRRFRNSTVIHPDYMPPKLQSSSCHDVLQSSLSCPLHHLFVLYSVSVSDAEDSSKASLLESVGFPFTCFRRPPGSTCIQCCRHHNSFVQPELRP